MSISDYAPDLPTFTGMALDRAMTERENPTWSRRLLDDPAARLIAASRDGVLVGNGMRRAGAGAADCRRPGREPILLGLEDGAGLFAVDLDALAPGTRAELRARGEVGVAARGWRGAARTAEAGLAAYLTALLNWHRRHRFCANCGSRHDDQGGRLLAALPALRDRTLPAHRSGGDHDRRARRPAAARAPRRLARSRATRSWPGSWRRAKSPRRR